MSEEEIIKYIKDEIEDETDTYHWFDNNPENKTRKQIEESINAHQGLLDLYNKEKEKNKELEEYKKYAELTKISCCNAQNCEALNNAIREGIENQNLKEQLKDMEKEFIEVCEKYRDSIPKSKIRELYNFYKNTGYYELEKVLEELLGGGK